MLLRFQIFHNILSTCFSKFHRFFSTRFCLPAIMKPRPYRAPRLKTSALAASSGDGAVEFRLRRSRSGLCVERRHFRGGAGRTIHAMRFASEASFLRWCDADELQFRFPLVYSNLRRRGRALLSSQPGAAAS
jgi:hypothetical protein